MIYEARSVFIPALSVLRRRKLIAKDSITCVKAGLIAKDYSVAYSVNNNVEKLSIVALDEGNLSSCV